MHLALDKDEAKQVFGRRTDQEKHRFLSELFESLKDSHRCCESGDLWNLLHRCLAGGTLQPDGGEYPLNQCVLGGRPLTTSSDQVTLMVRPDLIPHLVERLADVSKDWLREQYERIDPSEYELEKSEEEFERVWTCLEAVRDFFGRAALDRRAVVFTTAELAS